MLNKSVLEPFTDTQGLLNVGMFIPFGLLGVIATRRPGVVLTAGILMSATIEIAQGTAPFIAGICESGDFIANSTGAAIGAAIGLLLTRIIKTEQSNSRPTTVQVAAGAGGTVLILATVWALAINPVIVEWTNSSTSVSMMQRQAIEEAITDAFDGHYTVMSADFIRGPEGSGTIMAELAQDGNPSGAAELKWPDTEELSVSLLPPSLTQGAAYSVPGTGGPASSVEDATTIASAYAEQFAPWGVKNAELIVQSAEEAGWIISWRRFQEEVLMPMRLDVQVDKSGDIVHLLTRQIEDPPLPPVTITNDEAWRILENHFTDSLIDTERSEPILLAVFRDNSWGVDWILNAFSETELFYGTIDATTGSLSSPGKTPMYSDSIIDPELLGQ
ncbi:VanZ family protein [Streptomyces xiamenensis]|uniref:VanZ family protein n=1 Tax=Streptomyces xiamenensis TaxID=408015 RepID=UPI0036EF603E